MGLPVILVINTRGQGASVSALAQGFVNHRAGVDVAGVIFTAGVSPAWRREGTVKPTCNGCAPAV